MNRPAPPRRASAATPKEKTLLAFLIRRGWIFSEKGKGVFLSGFCPPSIRAVQGFNTDSAKRKSVFLGERIFRFASTDFPPAGGVWGGMRAEFALVSFGKNFATTKIRVPYQFLEPRILFLLALALWVV